MALSQHFQQVRKRALEAFLKNGFVVPMLYYLKGSKILAATPLLFPGYQKQAAYREILEKARRLEVDGFIEVSESWYVAPHDMEQDEPNLPPSKHPKRRECLVVVGRQRGASKMETQVRLYEILRLGNQVDLVRKRDEEPKNPEKLAAWFDGYFSPA